MVYQLVPVHILSVCDIFSCQCELFRGECGVWVWEGDYMVDRARPVLILSVAVFLLYWDSTASVQIASGATMS